MNEFELLHVIRPGSDIFSGSVGRVAIPVDYLTLPIDAEARRVNYRRFYTLFVSEFLGKIGSSIKASGIFWLRNLSIDSGPGRNSIRSFLSGSTPVFRRTCYVYVSG